MPSGEWAMTAVRHAVLADRAGQGAGVDAGQADDAAPLHPGRQVGVGAPVGRRGGDVAEDRAAGGASRRRARHLLDVLDVGPDVADVREGEGDDLGHVGGVGQDLLVAGHGGVEADLAHRLADRADADPLQDGPVGQRQDAGAPGSSVSVMERLLAAGDSRKKRAGVASARRFLAGM